MNRSVGRIRWLSDTNVLPMVLAVLGIFLFPGCDHRNEKAKATKDDPAQPGKDMTINLGDGVRMEFVWIDSLNGWVGKYEVTNQEYRRFRRTHHSGKHKNQTLDGDRQPAVQLSFEDATLFADWVNGRASSVIPPGYAVHLPDGKEWTSFAQCGGEVRTYPWGSDWPPKYGNYADAAFKRAFPEWSVIQDYDDGFAVSCPVEKSGTNEWGLYGVGGNAWEWTMEGDASRRVLRGASWISYDQNFLKTEYRFTSLSTYRYDDFGFRLVVSRGGLNLVPLGVPVLHS